MQNKDSSQGGDKKSGAASKIVAAPSIDLPRGGGAIKGIEEKFRANPATGSASFLIPLPFGRARGGMTPEVELSYDSGAGNGPFGLGWSLSIPNIARKTEKGLPQYDDARESDVFVMSGVEDLVPAGTVRDDGNFLIRTYRPRIEGTFARIEQWTEKTSGLMHWRTIADDDTTRIYGETGGGRISDPANPLHTFRWLLEFSHDGKGNAISYVYKDEDDAGVVPAKSSERNRLNGNAPCTNRYLKRILHGNAVHYDGTNRPASYLFQTVFDYGEHDAAVPAPDEVNPWPVRSDAFSQYRAGFDIRTRRLCTRILQFHNFAELSQMPCLVSSVDFRYGTNDSGMALLQQAIRKGYLTDGKGGYTSKALPAMSFAYQGLAWDTRIREMDADSLDGLPAGLADRDYHFIDLYGEGLPGILAEQEQGWYYKRNQGGGRFGAPALIAARPFTGEVSDIRDLQGDTEKYLADLDGDAPGFYRLDGRVWGAFQSFPTLPHIDFAGAGTRAIDLDGDGRADFLVDDDRTFLSYLSEGRDGFTLGRRFAKGFDEEKGPRLIFADPEQTIFSADMSGDGLTDIVRVRNGSVCYWPNLGYGRFGAKVTMEASPFLDHPDQFSPARVRLADVDGSGPADLLYIGRDKVSVWLNQSGNGYGAVREIRPSFANDNRSQVAVLDLLGTGTACLVWSSSLAGDARRQLRYIDLMNGKKPHLMIGYSNSCGKVVTLEYTPSTQFYLQDRAAGTPWVTRLPFPVHCLSKVTSYDHASGHRFSNAYSYHHGYYDVPEREFRGFGRVDELDSDDFEEYADASNGRDPYLHQAPVLMRTWYHVGAWIQDKGILDQYTEEYNSAYQNEAHLAQPTKDASWSPEEQREAMRAFKGRVLRQEVYAKDGTALAGVPYSATQTSYAVTRLQPQGTNHYAVFLVTECESLAYHYERDTGDPRVAHTLALRSDRYGRPTLEANVVYGRKAGKTSGIAIADTEQQKSHVAVTATQYTADVNDTDAFRMGETCAVKTWELTGASLSANIYTIADLNDAFTKAEEISFQDIAGGSKAQKRLVECVETLYLNDALSAPLDLGSLSAHGIVYESYTLAYTTSLIADIFTNNITNDALFAEGGYVQRPLTHADGTSENAWWVPTGRHTYASDATSHFYLPSGVRNPFGNITAITRDNYYLLITSVTDALGNVVTAQNDYRTLAPSMLIDPNGNRDAVATDELGMVVKTAVMGKVGSNEGDTLDDPTTRLEYGFASFDPTGNLVQPNYTHTYARETHGDHNSRWLEKVEYSDGSGHVLLTKTQAEPGKYNAFENGALVTKDSGTELRWAGTGRTILNNKGNPVKRYEPYFSGTSEFESEPELVETGVTPILHYDPPGRLVRTDLPDGTYSKVEFTPWLQKGYDRNDTVLDSVWYSDRGSPDPQGTEPLDPETRAAWLAAKHANTPTVTHLDSLGRAFYAVTDDGAGQKAVTRTVLDIEGNERAIYDGKGRLDANGRIIAVTESRHGIHGEKGYTKSMDAGERWMFLAVDGNPLYTWDSRNHRMHAVFDELRRPKEQWLLEDYTQAGTEKLVSNTVYGESAANPEAGNLRGKPWKSYGQSGLVESVTYDFKGNLLEGKRQFTITYNAAIDWNVSDKASLLETEAFTTITAYDALNRATSIQTPHHANIPASEVLPGYNEASLLESVSVKLRGAANATTFVSNIDYDAKGQRERIQYGNGAATGYSYEKKTFRLKRSLTTRNNGAEQLQDLNYTYDPVGNITQIVDDAQQTVYFNGSVVSPSQKFEYDARYRLTKATGRENIGNTGSTEPEDGGYPNVQTAMPSDAGALRRYERSWNYDEVGNILALIHNANNGNWTRSYGYASDSNRLESTAVGQTTLAYTHNVNGSMTTMPHLQAMDWDFAERLGHVTRGTTEAYYNYDGSGQRTRKVVEKNGITETRLYLGGFEIYRKKVNGALEMERETLHVMDDKDRVALAETKTVDAGAAIANPVSVLRYQLDNHLGSASLELDQNASVISYEEYYPYGDTSYQAGRSASEVSRKRYRYTGKEKDEESGLYYHEARYYACWLGRWTASDPAGLVDGVNLYMYVRGNPVRLRDPSGNAGTPPECTDQIDYNLPNQDVKALPDNPTLGGMRGNASGNFKLHLEPELGNDANSLVLLDDCKFNCGKSYTEAVKDLTVIVKAIGQQDLTDQQKNEIAKIPEPQNFLLLAKDAYTKGKAYLSDPKNRAQVEGFDQLRTETMGDSGKNEFYITGHTGKIKNLNPKIGVISNEGQKSVIPKYDPKDTVIFHSHPDENPLSFNGRYIKDSRGEYVEGRGGDLLASASSDKGVFAITPSGDIYFTTPKLAYFGITHSSLGLTPSSDGSGKFGQVYLGNIRDYRRDK